MDTPPTDRRSAGSPRQDRQNAGGEQERVAATTIASSQYRVSVNTGGRFVVATLTGNWTCETVDRYKIDLLSAGSRLIMAGVNAAEIGILVDTRAFGPQPQEVVSYYASTFGEKRFQGARIAVLFHSTLQKMQVRRMAVGSPHFFEHLDEAVRWLTRTD